ncbi:hypothetical protein [Amycolatopsis sp. WAC 04169]|uniref:hypothetical protein n=1 Tax=Amycolatopsis sp. WAC 04169 TaxID=2203197 RepID=UPI0018F328B6|nr:hypothetical protein [Amycolatopsis sp. WAC 04169]
MSMVPMGPVKVSALGIGATMAGATVSTVLALVIGVVAVLLMARSLHLRLKD